MTITLQTNARNAACDAIAALMNSGTLEFQTIADAEVATVTFGPTAFAAAEDGVAVANEITPDEDAAGGVATKFVAKTSAAAPVLDGNVGGPGSGADIVIDNTTVASGVTVDLSSFSITVPAS